MPHAFGPGFQGLEPIGFVWPTERAELVDPWFIPPDEPVPISAQFAQGAFARTVRAHHQFVPKPESVQGRCIPFLQ